MTITRTTAVRRLTWQQQQAELIRDTAARKIRETLDAGGTETVHHARSLSIAGSQARLYGTAVAALHGIDGDIDADDVAYWADQREAMETPGEQEAVDRIVDALTIVGDGWAGPDDLSLT
ncbi:hypothetical protein [Tomitella gaofuii]|uniref:hypothetical protein n=1 Tax=Tomitella gaofuii TaxID=2760083 RepID=UPI0015FBBE83|nr:hypothetical protein [Tomitella gaofuii]